MATIRIIGLGNGMRGDDVIGLLAARRLRQEIGDRAEVIEAEMAGVELIEMMKGARVMILIDAARSGGMPGTVHRIDASTAPISHQLFPRSTHAIGTVEAVELARTMGVLPTTVIVYGIEAANTEAGQALSVPVAKALNQVVDRIVEECEAHHA